MMASKNVALAIRDENGQLRGTISYDNVEEELSVELQSNNQVILRGISYRIISGSAMNFALDTVFGEIGTAGSSLSGNWRDGASRSGNWSVTEVEQAGTAGFSKEPPRTRTSEAASLTGVHADRNELSPGVRDHAAKEAGSGYLTVRANPPEAIIDVAGLMQLSGELLDDPCPPGTYVITVSAKGMKAETRTVVVQAGQHVAVEFNLLVDPEYQPNATRQTPPIVTPERSAQ